MSVREQECLIRKRANLEIRSQVLKCVRKFFEEQGFLDVETPLRTSAPAPEQHIEAIPADEGFFLATSPELYMKRLLSAGYERIYQVSRVFRKGELGNRHHPEFTMLEWYRKDAGYLDLQEDCRNLLTAVCASTGRLGRLEVPGCMSGCRSAMGGCDGSGGFPPLRGLAARPPGLMRIGSAWIWSRKWSRGLGFPAPAFLTDYPAGQAALARIKPEDPTVADTF